MGDADKLGPLIVVLDGSGGDARGRSFPFSLFGLSSTIPGYGPPFSLSDAHLTTLVPGAVRGNHFHRVQHEILFVVPADVWSLHWDTGDGTAVERKEFEGDNAAAVLVPPGCAHAIRNDGRAILHLVGLSDQPYTPDQPDAYPRRVV